MIKGKRVILRPVEERDLELLVCWRNAPENRQYFFSPFLINPGGQKKWYESLLADNNRVMFMVDTLEGKTVGTVALHNIDWRNQECEGGQVIIDPTERRQSYAEEAVKILLNYAFQELNLHRVYLLVFPHNEPTRSLAKRMGFTQEGVLRQAVFREGKFHNKIMLGLLREEWQSNQAGAEIDD